MTSSSNSLWGDGGQRAAAAAAAAAAAHFGYPGIHNHGHPLSHNGPPGSESVISGVFTNFSCDFWPNSSNSRSGNTNALGQRIKTSTKKTRRRVPTMAQRRAANIRERRRMFNLNEAFDRLRRRVPTFAYEKRLSRIETLRLAITYISFMAEIVNSPERSGQGILKSPKVSTSSSAHNNNYNCQNAGLKNGSNHHFSMNNGNGNAGTNSVAGLIGHTASLINIDCHQNQNVPPPISPFPLSRIYSSHSSHHHHHGYLASSPSGLPH